MSSLLALALVALAIVVGVSWWQRRPHGTSLAGQASSGRSGSAPVADGAQASPSAAAAGASGLQRTDPVFGPIAYYGGGRWLRDGDLEFGGSTIVLEVACGKGGPEDVHREWLTAFVARAPAWRRMHVAALD